MKLRFFLGSAAIGCFLLSQCTSFAKHAGKNQFLYEEEHISCVNIPNRIVSVTFGDFQYASNLRTWKKLNDTSRFPYKNVLLYAQTKNPDYDYYLVLDTVVEGDTGYTFVPKYVNGEYLTLIISNKAPKTDAEFIYEGIRGL